MAALTLLIVQPPGCKIQYGQFRENQGMISRRTAWFTLTTRNGRAFSVPTQQLTSACYGRSKHPTEMSSMKPRRKYLWQTFFFFGFPGIPLAKFRKKKNLALCPFQIFTFKKMGKSGISGRRQDCKMSCCNNQHQGITYSWPSSLPGILTWL